MHSAIYLNVDEYIDGKNVLVGSDAHGTKVGDVSFLAFKYKGMNARIPVDMVRAVFDADGDVPSTEPDRPKEPVTLHFKSGDDIEEGIDAWMGNTRIVIELPNGSKRSYPADMIGEIDYPAD